MRVLVGLVAGVALGAGSLAWWLAGEAREPDAAAPRARAAVPGTGEPSVPAPSEREFPDVDELVGLVEHDPEGEPRAEPKQERETPFGAWEPPRDTPEFEGPLVETWHAEGVREFAGSQILDADGRWRLDGPWSAWHPNGAPMELGAYVMGREEGPWQWWYDDGTPMAQGSWVEGQRIGRWSFWQEDGALGAVGHYVDGEGDGPWTLYHANGAPWISGELAHGAPVGLWQVWSEDGTLDLERTGVWQNGELTSSGG